MNWGDRVCEIEFVRRAIGEKLAVAGVDGEEAVSEERRKGRDGRLSVFLANAGSGNGGYRWFSCLHR